jgi:hypothetical protein
MKYVAAILLSLVALTVSAEETKDIKVDGKKLEVRVPKSAKIDCKKPENASKTECKKESKAMPKIEKPVATAPKDEPKKDSKKK